MKRTAQHKANHHFNSYKSNYVNAHRNEACYKKWKSFNWSAHSSSVQQSLNAKDSNRPPNFWGQVFMFVPRGFFVCVLGCLGGGGGLLGGGVEGEVQKEVDTYW